jgi:hypothetical protein
MAIRLSLGQGCRQNPFGPCQNVLTFQHFVKIPSKSPSNLVKLGHTRRYGAHFEDLDEAHPSKVLQEAFHYILSPISKKPPFWRVKTLSMSSAIQQVPFPLHESPRPLIQYVGPSAAAFAPRIT